MGLFTTTFEKSITLTLPVISVISTRVMICRPSTQMRAACRVPSFFGARSRTSISPCLPDPTA